MSVHPQTAPAEGTVVFNGDFRDLACCGIQKCAPITTTLSLNMANGELDMVGMERPKCCMPKGGCCGTGAQENTAWVSGVSSVTIVGKDKGCCYPCGQIIRPCVLCATCGKGKVDCGGAAGLYIVGPATGWSFHATSAFFIPLTIEDARSARDCIKAMKRPTAANDMIR